MEKGVRWMLAALLLELAAVWCIGVAHGTDATGLFQTGCLALPIASAVCAALGIFRRGPGRAARWTLLGGYLLAAAVWCMTFAFVGGFRDYRPVFLIGLAPLPILAAACFAVGIFRRGT